MPGGLLPGAGGARSICLVVGLLPAVILILSGCTTVVVRRGVEKRVERRLHEVLGPAERYEVRIRDTRDAELVRGFARRVEVQGRRIRARDQMELETLDLALVDLRYEGGDPYFVSVRRSDLEISFTDAALNRYLRVHQARYDPEIVFEPDRVRVKIVYPFLGVPTTIRAEGTFLIREGRQLLFDADKADVSFLDQPGFGEKFVEDRVNPILDMSRIDFPARLESVQLLQGRIKAYGTAALPREVRD